MVIDIDILLGSSLTANQYLLACFIDEENEETFVKYTQKCGKFRVEDIRKLIDLEYLVYTGSGDTYNFYELYSTQKLEELSKAMKEESEGIIPPIKAATIDDFDYFCEKFQDIFPKGVKPAGKPVRSSLQDIKKKLSRFEKDYPEYSRDEILIAAKSYVDRFKLKSYSFMRTAVYFIHKQNDGSDLAAEVEMVRDRGLVVKPKYYGTHVQ